MKLSIAFCLLTFTLTCCFIKKGSTFEVKLDNELQEILVDYLKENNIDSNRKVIITEWVVNPNDKIDVYISNINTDLYRKKKYTPSYYATLRNGAVVFIYTNVESLIDRDIQPILIEIEDLLKEKAVTLKSDSGFQYSAPTWLYTSCSGGINKVTKKLNPLEYNFIPCGYALRQDTLKADSIYILRK